PPGGQAHVPSLSDLSLCTSPIIPSRSRQSRAISATVSPVNSDARAHVHEPPTPPPADDEHRRGAGASPLHVRAVRAARRDSPRRDRTALSAPTSRHPSPAEPTMTFLSRLPVRMKLALVLAVSALSLVAALGLAAWFQHQHMMAERVGLLRAVVHTAH